MTPKQQAYKILATSMIKNFAKRNMEAFYCETKEEATALAMEIMRDAKTVGMGGAESVKENEINSKGSYNGEEYYIVPYNYSHDHILLECIEKVELDKTPKIIRSFIVFCYLCHKTLIFD